MKSRNLFLGIIIIFVGAIMPAEAVWALADITMGGMAFFNLPSCIALSGVVMAALKDYERQKKAGHDPVFRAKHIGMDENELDCWKMGDHLSHEKDYVED
jgi:AGCS family alanine or glycine:cation symporter